MKDSQVQRDQNDEIWKTISVGNFTRAQVKAVGKIIQ